MSAQEPYHPDDEALVRLACGDADELEVARLRRHIDSCDECAEVWRAVEQVQQEASRFDPGARPSEARSRRLRPVHWLGLAAAAALAIVVLQPGGSPDAPEPTASETVRSAASLDLVLESPLESQRVVDPVFSWQPFLEAQSYSIELVDAAGELLWHSGHLQATSAPWPDTIEHMPGSYYWRVVAHRESGLEPLVSPLVSFELVDQD